MEVGAVRSGVWFSIPLRSLAADVTHVGPDGPDSEGMCMTVMATTLEHGAPLEEVFFGAEQADRLGRWLEHHEMPANQVVQAFLTARGCRGGCCVPYLPLVLQVLG